MVTIQTVLGREYEVFGGGSYVSKMSELISAGFSPFSVADVMRARLEAAKSNDKNKKDFWLNTHFDTVDGVAYYKAEVKVVCDSGHLRSVSSGSRLRDGALELSVSDFSSLEGLVFSRGELKKCGIGKLLSRDEAKGNPVWRTLARNDDTLLSDYVDFIFDEIKEHYGYDKRMGVYLSSRSKVPLLRAWFADGPNYWCLGNGLNDLSRLSRLVGVRS